LENPVSKLFQTFSEIFDPKTGFLTHKQGFLTQKQEIISKLFLQNFHELKKTVISKKNLNFEKQTFPKLPTKSSEISV